MVDKKCRNKILVHPVHVRKLIFEKKTKRHHIYIQSQTQTYTHTHIHNTHIHTHTNTHRQDHMYSIWNKLARDDNQKTTIGFLTKESFFEREKKNTPILYTFQEFNYG